MSLQSASEILQEVFNTDNILECFELEREHYTKPMTPIEHFAKPEFHYQAPGNFNPPLPTIKDIANARNTALTNHFDTCQVYVVFDTYVVKFSTSPIILQEAENLLFLEKNSDVKAPKVYAVFSNETEDPLRLQEGQHQAPLFKYYYLVMEYIPGTTLSSELWITLSLTAQKDICAKISEQLRRLRQVKFECKSFYYGRIGRLAWHRAFPMFSHSGQEACGPYNSYEDLKDAMFKTVRLRAAVGNLGRNLPPSAELALANFKRSLNADIGDQTPTLTYLDLKFDNIVIEKIPVGKEGDAEEYNVTMVDWQCLGWLPPWVQASAIKTRFIMNPRAPNYDILMLEILRNISPFNLALADFLTECCLSLLWDFT